MQSVVMGCVCHSWIKQLLTYVLLLGDIDDKQFCILRSLLPVPWVCLSVCLSRSCIVLKRQKISIRFLCIRQPRVSPRSR